MVMAPELLADNSALVSGLLEEEKRKKETVETLVLEAFAEMEAARLLDRHDLLPNDEELSASNQIARDVLRLTGSELRLAIIGLDMDFNEDETKFYPIRDAEAYAQDPTLRDIESGPITFFVGASYKRLRDRGQGTLTDLAKNTRTLTASRTAQSLLSHHLGTTSGNLYFATEVSQTIKNVRDWSNHPVQTPLAAAVGF